MDSRADDVQTILREHRKLLSNSIENWLSEEESITTRMFSICANGESNGEYLPFVVNGGKLVQREATQNSNPRSPVKSAKSPAQQSTNSFGSVLGERLGSSPNLGRTGLSKFHDFKREHEQKSNTDLSIANSRRGLKKSNSRVETDKQLRSIISEACGEASTNMERRGSVISDASDRDKARKEAAISLSERRHMVMVSSSHVHHQQKLMIQRMVESAWFECTFIVLIVFNSIFVGVQVEYSAINMTYETPTIFFIIGVIFALMFTLELVVRIWAYGKQFFIWSDVIFWNYLDVFIVSSTLFELILDIITLGEDYSAEGSKRSNIRVVRILRIARFLRVVRIARVLRFVHALRTFIYSIMATLKALVWALVLLFGILYVFGILFTQTVSDYFIEEDEANISQESAVLHEFWDSLPKSMFTLFKSISNGISWHECVHALHVLGWIWVAAFLVFVSFTYFAVLNVVTGIFCQSAIDTAHNNEDLLVQEQMNQRDALVTRMRKLFKELDTDESGSLTILELEYNLDVPDVRAVFDSLQIDTSDAWALFKLLDTDEGNEIDVDEFVHGLMRLKGEPKRSDILELEVKVGMVMKGVDHLTQVLHEHLQVIAKSFMVAESISPSIYSESPIRARNEFSMPAFDKMHL